jgi:tetraacyldisaccharide 4'-kinase
VLYTGGRRSTPLPGCVGHRSLLAPRRLADWWVDAQGVAATRGDRDGDLAASALHGDWSAWQGRAVIACAGLARPQAFFEQLAALGLQVDGRPLPDHDALHNPPWDDAATDVLVTEKDAVKLDPRSPRNARVWVVALDFRPEPAFEAELHDLCTPLLPPERGDTAIATPHEP